MLSSKPYLLRALHEWILDSHCTPHVVVDALFPGVVVPREHVKDGQIVLNVSLSAVTSLQIGSDEMTFNARFSGTPMNVRVPVAAVQGIYARENGQGMMFPQEIPPDLDPQDSGAAGEKPVSGRPSLRVVK